MYKDFFRFTSYPFHNTPDPAFYYSSLNHREALAMLVYGIEEGKGFMVITGDVGTGKTMLVHALRQELSDKHVMIEIANPWVSAEEVLSAIWTRLGRSSGTPEEPALLDALKDRLTKLADEGRRVVLVIDEAHQIPERTLEGMRLLSNIETSTRKLIQIILLGQEELSTMLGRYSLRQVQQRIALSYHLNRLSESETADYIRHRLKVAGGDLGIFSPASLALIYQQTAGTPRVINQLCDNCLLLAYGKYSQTVDEGITREVISSMRPQQLALPLPQSQEVAPATVPAWDTNTATGWRSDASRTDASRTDESDTPPFRIPSRQSQEAPTWGSNAGSGGSSGRRLSRMAVTMLVLGLALNAVAFWFALRMNIDLRSLWTGLPTEASGGIERIKPPEPRPAPGVGRSLPMPLAPESAALRPATELPLPNLNAATSAFKEVTVTSQLTLASLASQQYGAWNATVRDLVAVANPALGNLENLPPESRVRLPVLTRSAMVVQDPSGKFFVFFASFDKEDVARSELEALKQVWSSAVIVPAQRQGNTVFRLYVGALASRNEAETVANSLWFKHLPAFSQG